MFALSQGAAVVNLCADLCLLSRGITQADANSSAYQEKWCSPTGHACSSPVHPPLGSPVRRESSPPLSHETAAAQPGLGCSPPTAGLRAYAEEAGKGTVSECCVAENACVLVVAGQHTARRSRTEHGSWRHDVGDRRPDGG